MLSMTYKETIGGMDSRPQSQFTSSPGPRISIALCTYNGERYLREQLESFAWQTRQPYELVVCDDGSTDATVEIVSNFARRVTFPVHVHINPANLGSSKNFEQAMWLCAGDFIALSDQDDIWLPNKLDVLATVLAGDPEIGGTFSDGELIDYNSRPLDRGLWDAFGFGKVEQRKFLREGASSVLITRVVVTGATLMLRASTLPVLLPIPAGWVHDGWMAWMLAIYSRVSFSTDRLIRYRVHASQQVGVGAGSLAQRIARAKATAAQDYLQLADELTLLRNSLMRSAPSHNNLSLQLQGKIDHCRRCAALPPNPVLRLANVVAHLPDYCRYSRALRSMSKDLLAAL